MAQQTPLPRGTGSAKFDADGHRGTIKRMGMKQLLDCATLLDARGLLTSLDPELRAYLQGVGQLLQEGGAPYLT